MSVPPQTPPPAQPPPFSDDTTAAYSGYVGGVRSSTIPDGVGFGPRFVARVIDTLVHSVAAVSAGMLMRVIVFSSSTTSVDLATVGQRLGSLAAGDVLAGMVAFAAYHTVCEGLHGSSLGKFLLGQVVVTDQVRPCGLRAALIRSLAYYVDTLFLGLIGYLEMRKTRLAKRHGDNWADTFVARRSQVPIGTLRSTGRFLGVLALALAVDSAILITWYVVKMM